MASTPFFLPTPTLKFTPTGKWAVAQRLLGTGTLRQRLKSASIAAQEKLAKDILKEVKRHLRNQDLGWPTLSPEYLARKRKAGWDRRILIGTRTYHDNITFWSRANGWQVFVGVKKGIYGRTLSGKKARRDVATIATYHEFGRRGKVKRPLWNPTIKQMGGVRGLKRLYITYLEQQLRRRGLSQYLTRLKP